MSKLAKYYIYKPLNIIFQTYTWNFLFLIMGTHGAYGSIFYIFPKDFQLIAVTVTNFFLKKNPQKNLKNFLGLFYILFLCALRDVSLSYKFILEMRGIGFKVFLKAANAILEVGFSHQLIFNIPDFVYLQILDKKNTKFLIKGLHRHLVHQVANNFKMSRIPNEYTLKGVHYKNQWLKKKPGKQAQQK
jgi:ribosomal protein L6P/L9E